MKRKVKGLLDAVMSVLFVVCMGYQITGNKWHEIIGVGMFALFVVHCVLNGYWFANFIKIMKGTKGNVNKKIGFIVDNLVILDMIVLAVTSVLISRSVFAGLDLPKNFFMTRLHISSAYLGFVLVSVHLGCHWSAILNTLYRTFKISKDNKIAKVAGRVIAAILVVTGIFYSFERNVASKIFMLQAGKSGHKGVEREGFDDNDRPEIREEDLEEFKEKHKDGEGRGFGKGNHQFNGDGEGKHQYGQEMSVNTQITEDVEEGESLEDYLGKLVCTGCGRACPLISPQCGKGQAQAEAATQKYNESQSSADSNVQSDNGTESNDNMESDDNADDITDYNSEEDNSTTSEQEETTKKLVIYGDDTVLSLFGGFLPIAGMYIAGTYYTLELVKKKQKK